MSLRPQEDPTPGPVLRAVDRCAEICLERQCRCSRASEDLSARGLKRLLAHFAEERRHQALAFLALTPPLGGRFQPGRRMRRWPGPGARNDRSVLEYCIAGDDAARVELQVVFGWAPLVAMPMEVRALMLSTYVGTLRLLAELRGRLAAA